MTKSPKHLFKNATKKVTYLLIYNKDLCFLCPEMRAGLKCLTKTIELAGSVTAYGRLGCVI